MALMNLAFVGGLCVFWCGLAFCKSVFLSVFRYLSFLKRALYVFLSFKIYLKACKYAI